MAFSSYLLISGTYLLSMSLIQHCCLTNYTLLVITKELAYSIKMRNKVNLPLGCSLSSPWMRADCASCPAEPSVPPPAQQRVIHKNKTIRPVVEVCTCQESHIHLQYICSFLCDPSFSCTLPTHNMSYSRCLCIIYTFIMFGNFKLLFYDINQCWNEGNELFFPSDKRDLMMS